MKRLLTGFLSMAMMISMLAACGNNTTQTTTQKPAGGETTQAGQTTTEGKPEPSGYVTTYGEKQFDNVTVTVELFDRSNAPEGSTILENRWTQHAQDAMAKVGINLEFVAVPRSDEITKMQTMMASGTAPDLTLTYTYSYAEDYFLDGGIWDLTEFIDGEDQAKNLKAYLGEDVMNIGRGHDALYGIVARRATTANSNLFVRNDWVEKLNMELPSTPDELYEYVKATVQENPDGLTNVIGAYFWGLESTSTGTGYRNNMTMAFSEIADDPKALDIADHNDFYMDPGYREYVRYMNKFYNEGLMNKEFYASTTDLFTQQMVNSQLSFYESNVNYNVDPLRNSPETTLRANTPGAEFISIPALKNVKDGEIYSTAYSPGGLIIMVPKTASADKVEAAMTYLDWIATPEGGFVFYHGFEGEHYELDEFGAPIVKDSAYNAKDKDWIRHDMFLVGNQGYFATVEDFNKVTAAENPTYYDDVVRNYENSLAGTIVNNTYFTSPLETETKDDILLLRSEYQVQCITAKPEEMDAIYDEWIAEAKKAGLDDVIAERTAYFDVVYGN